LNRVIKIFLCDLRRRMKSPLAIFLMMLVPLTMTLLIGLVFGSQNDGSMPTIKVLLVDRDNGIVSRFLKGAMQQDTLATMLDLEVVDSAKGEEMMAKGKASAMIEIPEGFTADFIERRPVEIRILKNPSESFLPVIVEEMIKTGVVLLDRVGFIFSGPLGMLDSIFESGRFPEGEKVNALLSQSRDGMILSGGYLSGAILKFRSETVSPDEEDEEEEDGLNIYAYVLPGSMVFGLLFISQITLKDLVREKQGGTLRRVLASPASGSEIAAGKVLVTFSVTALVSIIIIVVSVLAFGIEVGSPLPLVIHFIGVMLMCTGIMSFMFGLIPRERVADTVIPVVILVLALFGGSMVPFEQLPGILQRIGRLSPVYWGGRGFRQLFLMDASLGDIIASVLVCYGVGLATLLPGGFLIERKLVRRN